VGIPPGWVDYEDPLGLFSLKHPSDCMVYSNPDKQAVELAFCQVTDSVVTLLPESEAGMINDGEILKKAVLAVDAFGKNWLNGLGMPAPLKFEKKGQWPGNMGGVFASASAMGSWKFICVLSPSDKGNLVQLCAVGDYTQDFVDQILSSFTEKN
jgi:hypothetical protein